MIQLYHHKLLMGEPADRIARSMENYHRHQRSIRGAASRLLHFITSIYYNLFVYMDIRYLCVIVANNFPITQFPSGNVS